MAVFLHFLSCTWHSTNKCFKGKHTVEIFVVLSETEKQSIEVTVNVINS